MFRRIITFTALALTIGVASLIGPASHAEQASNQQQDQQQQGPQGRALPPGDVEQYLGPIPLRALDVDARVEGNLAEVTVEQIYENNLGERLEAVYVFPLPDDAAVTEMILLVGQRRVRADLRERAQARRAYEQARRRGQTASLLEQERPNIFTMSVANITPGEPVRVLVRYVEELPYRDGRYHFHFPTTVGPRFVPGALTGHAGTGQLADTDQVPDASRITPATLPQGVRTPYEVDFSLELQGGMAVESPRNDSRDLALTRLADDRLRATLLPDRRQPNRDIELSYALVSNGPAFGLLTHADRQRGGFFSLMLEPPTQLDADDVRPKEMVFVVDNSGSMSGVPIETAKATIRHALREMNPNDTFQIVRFSDASSSLSPVPLANTAANVRRGLAFVDAMRGGGGTVMTAGIEAALRPPPDAQRMRIVLFLTDGYIGNERQILELIDEQVGESRLFSLGVGSSVNRYLLDRMAERGRGAVHYMDAGDEPTEEVTTFYDRIRNPVLTDIEVDWGDQEVFDVTPARVPDVFSGTPIQVAGRYRGPGRARVTIRGKQGNRRVSIPLTLTFPGVSGSSNRPAVAHLWARRRIHELELEHGTDRDAARQSVLPLALRYGLLTAYTSFVAIEERVRADADDPLHTRGVPVALPESMSDADIGPQIVPVPIQASSSGGTIGLGNINTFGYGGGAASGSGSGYGRGSGSLRGRRASTPRVRVGRARVRGSLSREVVRRYIRRHINQVRGCYERALAHDSSLAGRVAVRFVIAPDGQVRTATIARSTLNNPQVEACIARAFQQIRFPAVSDGGVIVITYPLLFQPSP